MAALNHYQERNIYSESELDAAVKAGAIGAKEAANLRTFIAGSRSSPAVDEEQFRLLTGFNDIFVSIAVALILIAISWITIGLSLALSGASVAAASWGLAEYFTRQRRMALPSILLLVTFVLGTLSFAIGALAPNLFMVPHAVMLAATHLGYILPVGAMVATGAAYVHWRRFHVPITIAAGALVAALGLVSFAKILVPSFEVSAAPAILSTGLAIFLLGMGWDMSDRSRITRRSDVAFWLHLAAAPMIVHPLFKMLGLLSLSDAPVWKACAVLGIYFILALIALAIDRRALLVSALAYVLFAMSALLHAAGSVSMSFAFTALIIGSALLLLSALWHNARRLVVRPLPPSVQNWLPVL